MRSFSPGFLSLRHIVRFVELVCLGFALSMPMNGASHADSWARAVAPLVEITGIKTDTGRSATDAITQNAHIALIGLGPAGQRLTLTRLGIGQIGTILVDTYGNWTFDYTDVPLASGLHRFQATGNEQTSTPFTVIIDTALPPAPKIEQVGSFPLVISGTSEPGCEVTVTIDGQIPAGTCFTENSGVWSLVYAPPVSAGSHFFVAAATDLAGNVSENSTAISFDSRLSPPIIVSAISDTGTLPNSSTTADPTVSLSGTALDGTIISISREGFGLVGTATVDPRGAWTFDYTKTILSDNVHRFTATASNEAGTSLSSTVFVLRVDTLSPAVVAITRQDPSVGTVIDAAVNLTYRVEFSEDVTGVTTHSFILTTTGSITAQIARVIPITGSTYDITLTALTGEGTLRLDLSTVGSGVLDFAGNPAADFASGELYTRMASRTDNRTWARLAVEGFDPIRKRPINAGDLSLDDAGLSKQSVP